MKAPLKGFKEGGIDLPFTLDLWPLQARKRLKENGGGGFDLDSIQPLNCDYTKERKWFLF